MLNVPRLDDLDYDRIFERARGMIPTLTEDWTDLNYHDPGITTLQTFAWLYDTLNYYMNATGEAHRLKYLKLLGIEPCRRAAVCNVALEGEGELRIPAGTRFSAGDTVFETRESYHASANRLSKIFCETDGAWKDLTPFAGTDGGFASVFTLDRTKESRLYLGFEHPLEEKFRFYVEVEEGTRNPFGDDFSLSRLEWEYFDGKDWKEAYLTEDQTCGFLRGGYISLRLEGGAPQITADTPDNALRNALAQASVLRCRLLENEYDVLPRIGRISCNCLPVMQQNTWARAMELSYDGSGELVIDRYVRETDLVGASVFNGEEYEEWYRHSPDASDLCEFQYDPAGSRFRFDQSRFGRAPEAGARILITILSNEAAPAAFLGHTDGCAEQRLPFDAENICGLKLALARTDGNGRRFFQLWDSCNDLRSADFRDRVFAFDEASRQIIFGDSIHGMQPENGLEVWAVEIRTSRFEEGNVLAGQIASLPDPVTGVTAVCNYENARGGLRLESAEELEPRIEGKMRAVTRAVTMEDYRTLVLHTPGLIIDSVAVIPMKDYCRVYSAEYRANTVLIAVKPGSSEELPALSSAYRQAVEKHLERYRLLTTDIRIIPARYVGISVYGRICLRENSSRSRQLVEEYLKEQINTLKTGEFGRGVDYGRLFSRLEVFDCIKSVAQLSLEYIGDGGRKEEQGGIAVGPDSLCYLREVGIEYM